MDMEKKSPLRDVMNSTMEKVREMVDANNIVGAPITTPDGVTLIPISRVSFGFGSGGGSGANSGDSDRRGGGYAEFLFKGLYELSKLKNGKGFYIFDHFGDFIRHFYSSIL